MTDDLCALGFFVTMGLAGMVNALIGFFDEDDE
jgi:hypothetical protein